LGGESTPAIGWALGEERIVGLMQAQGITAAGAIPDVVLVIVGTQAEASGLALAEKLRDAVPALRIDAQLGGGSFKSQLKRADKSGAKFALILGDGETERRVAGLKSLRAEEPQIEISWEQLAAELARRI
jgi:histidyl-tRNA synthetase